ncbi:MAG: non-homologous end-joining DNA ligase [bacterium]
MPELIAPMLATPGTLPPAGQDGQWAFEMKWDGVRAVVYLARGKVEIRSRIGRDVTVSYPELRGLADAVGDAVLDGEIVALDDSGVPSFGVLQQRMHVADAKEARRLAGAVPAVFLAFDVLGVGGETVLQRPWSDRRELLDQIGLSGGAWQTPPVFHGGGAEALAASRAQRLEGVVAKRTAAPYQPGARSRDWVKVKHIRMQEVVVGGWKRGQGRRSGTVGSLLIGVPGSGGLQYAGHVGTGFSDAALGRLSRQLAELAREESPFVTAMARADTRDAHWVEPVLVGEVAFTEWTSDGRLRHPAWRGLRSDKRPGDVVRGD